MSVNMSAHIWAWPVYYNKPLLYSHISFSSSLDKDFKTDRQEMRTSTLCKQIILLVSLVSCQWLDVSPQGQRGKAHLEKNILGVRWRKKSNHCGGENNLQTSTEGLTALAAAEQSSLTPHSTPGDNYSDWVCIACVSVHHPVVPQ